MPARTARFTTLAVAALLIPALRPAAAAEWQHSAVAYLMASGLEGQTQIGALSTDIDASFSDLVDHLEFGLAGAYRGQKDRLVVSVDAMYTALGGESTGSGGLGLTFEADVDQFIAAADIGYVVSERLDVMAGIRYVDVDLGVEVRAPGGGALAASSREDWFDPYVGFRSVLPLGKDWRLVLRGDVGGFDAGSELTWQMIARAEWWIRPGMGLTFGYRVLDIDYENGSDADYFKYDINQSGPVVGFGWRF